MKVLYYDVFCGISGDMNLGAMVDLGVDFEYLKSVLGKLNIDEEKNSICFGKGYFVYRIREVGLPPMHDNELLHVITRKDKKAKIRDNYIHSFFVELVSHIKHNYLLTKEQMNKIDIIIQNMNMYKDREKIWDFIYK